MENKQIFDALIELRKQIEILSSRLELPPLPSKSESLKELFTALAKAQAEMKTAGLNAENPYFKSTYSDLAEIVRVSRPSLAKNGLSVIQQVLPNDDGQNILHCILAHCSGEWIETRMRILPAKNDIQSMASYITYLRRYSYAAIVGVVTSEEDDDGEKAVHDQRETASKGVALNNKYNPKEQSYDSISADQIQEMEYELAQYPDIAELVLEGLKIQSIADIPKSKYRAAITRIREIKQIRNEGSPKQ